MGIFIPLWSTRTSEYHPLDLLGKERMKLLRFVQSHHMKVLSLEESKEIPHIALGE